MRRRRRGFLLYLVLGILAVIGILLLALDAMSRQRNRLAHRAESARVAEHLVEGAVSYLQYRMREELAKPPPRTADLGTPLTNERLFGFLLLPADELEEEVGRAAADDLLARWIAPDWKIPLDDLRLPHRGATLDVRLEAKATPLHPSDGRYRDAVEKTVELGLVAESTFRGVRRQARRVFEVKVAHPFPPMTSKFTLFVDRVPNPSDEFNVYENDEAGASTGSPAQDPFILRNTPLGDVDDRTHFEDNIPSVEAGDPWAGRATQREVLGDRGWIYLGTGAGNSIEVGLNLTAGPELYDASGIPMPGERGEFFQLYDPLRYHSAPSFYRLLPGGAPAPFRAPLAQPMGGMRQAFINFLFWGFHSEGSHDLGDAGLGTSLGTKNSSILHLFGDDDDPSRTKVFGRVVRRFIRFAYLAVDRKIEPDPTGPDDEVIQAGIRDANGYSEDDYRIFERDSIAPIFAYVPDPASFDREVEKERNGEPMDYLKPIPTVQNGAEGPENQNFFPDLDGDGRGDVILDPGHPKVRLDAVAFNYGRLFPQGYSGNDGGVETGYENYMSRVLEIPFNQVTDFMAYSGVIPPEKHPAFQGWTAADDLEALAAATDVAVDFEDPLHDHLGAEAMFRGDLSTFLSEEFEDVVRRRAFLRLPDQAALMRRFPLAANPFSPDDPLPWMALESIVLIGAGGLELPALAFPLGGALVVASGDVVLRGVEPRGFGLPTIIALDGNIVLDGPGPYHGLFAAPRGEIRNAGGTPLMIQGSVAAGSLRATALERGGEIRYAASADPTRYLGGAQPSYADFYHVGLADFPHAWGPAE